MTTTTLADGSTTSDPRLGRLPQFDDRSRNFPVRAALTADQQALVNRQWYLAPSEPVLDQGDSGACVGFGVTNELRFTPVPIPGLDATFAHDTVYWTAQKLDDWPGGSYPSADPVYEGTSVLAGIKTGVQLGYYGEYRWAFSETDLALSVGHIGPAVIGINWYDSMFKPDAQGYVTPTGSIAGGHCLLVCGINATHGYYVLYNSWGPTWGLHGTCKLRRASMARLLADQGDAAIITVRTKPATV